MDEIRNNKCLQTFAFITIILVIAYIMNNAYFSKLEGFDNTEAISNIASLYNQSLLTVTKMKTNELLGNPTLTMTGNTNVKGDLTVNGNFINATINKKIDDAINELKNISKSYGKLTMSVSDTPYTSALSIPITQVYKTLSIPSSYLVPSINFEKYSSSGLKYIGPKHVFLINCNIDYNYDDHLWIVISKNGIDIPDSVKWKDGTGYYSETIITQCVITLNNGDIIYTKVKSTGNTTMQLFAFQLTITQID